MHKCCSVSWLGPIKLWGSVGTSTLCRMFAVRHPYVTCAICLFYCAWAVCMCVWHACAVATTSCALRARGRHFHSIYSSKMMISFEFHLIYFHLIFSLVCVLLKHGCVSTSNFENGKNKTKLLHFVRPPAPYCVVHTSLELNIRLTPFVRSTAYQRPGSRLRLIYSPPKRIY